MNNLCNRVIKAFCLLFALLMLFMSFPISSSAIGVENPMHETYVCDDLKNLGFDLSKYPKDTSADWIKVIDFVEYGYDKDGNQAYYGLYLYIYNPSGREILAGNNNVQMSFTDVAGREVPFNKYGVIRMSASMEPGSEFTLYKLYIASSYSIGMRINGSLTRKYTISGLELQFDGSPYAKPVDNLIGASWTYTNYQKNFGTDLDNQLHCDREIEECVKVKMEAASWYSKTSDLGEDYRYEVSSVYFNIPNTFIEAYGNPKDATSGLRTVKGEYYKYVTDGLVVPDEEWYGYFEENIGVELQKESTYHDNFSDVIDTAGFYIWDNKPIKDGYVFRYEYSLSYNVFVGNGTLCSYVSSDVNNHICNLAVSTGDDTMYLSQEDFLATYNKWGRNHYGDTGGLSMKNADKFTGLGKQPLNISTTDGNLGEAINTYASSKKDGIGKWLHKLFNKELYDDEDKVYDIAPIVQIEGSDIGKNMTSATIADNLYVMVEDVEGIRNFYDEYSKNNKIFLMRLEVNPYYATEVTLNTSKMEGAANESNIAKGIYFEKAVFEDIDIFTFTFEDKSGEYKTVPVSCDPIDNVGAVIPGNNAGLPNQNDPDATSRDDSMDWWLKFWEWFKDQEIGYKILIIIVIIIVIMLLIRLVGALLGVGSAAIVKAMGTIVAAPFRVANNVRNKVKEKNTSDKAPKKEKKGKSKYNSPTADFERKKSKYSSPTAEFEGLKHYNTPSIEINGRVKREKKKYSSPSTEKLEFKKKPGRKSKNQ